MSQTTDIPQKDKPTLEQELEQLQVAEANLERKTKDMWSAEVVALVVAFVALLMSAAGLAAGLSHATGGNTTVMMRSPAAAGSVSSGAAATKTAMPAAGSAMMGKRAASGAVGATAARTVSVKLGEMWVRPSRTSITAGKVTFVARNTGMLTHELMIERMPLKMSGDHPVENAAQGMIQDMATGAMGRMTLTLKPGTYMLFCNVPGHYASGQHVPFTVTKA